MSVLLSSFSVEVYFLCVTCYVLVCCVSGGWYSSCSDIRSLFTRQLQMPWMPLFEAKKWSMYNLSKQEALCQGGP